MTFSGEHGHLRAAGCTTTPRSATLTNLTFSDNLASLDGGAMVNEGSSPEIYDSIFWNNGDEIANLDVGSVPVLLDNIVAGGLPGGRLVHECAECESTAGATGEQRRLHTDHGTEPPQPGQRRRRRERRCAFTDQRGISRPQGPACDMGAYEYDGVETTPPTGLWARRTAGCWSPPRPAARAARWTRPQHSSTWAMTPPTSSTAASCPSIHRSLPDTATITAVTLKIKKTGLVGANPFSSLGDIIVDIKNGSFSSNPDLQKTDFKALATKNYVAKFTNAPVGSWYSTALGAGSFGYINRTGTTQFRLRFATDDNNNLLADYLKFASGNAITTSRPQLVITYFP